MSGSGMLRLLTEFTMFCRFLHELLTRASIVSRRVPILVALNKTDLHAAVDSTALMATLEMEVEKRRRAAQSKLADMTRDGAAEAEKRSLPDTPFRWADAPVPVTHARIAAKHNQLAPVLEFIKAHAA